MNAPMPEIRAAAPEADLAEVLRAAEAAVRRVAPLWPLSEFVAVNPFLGLSDRGLEEAAAEMARAAGARLTRPREAYLEACEAGRITPADLAEALAERRGEPALPGDPQALISLARLEEGARPQPLPTVAGLAGEADGRDWAGFVNDRISALCADHFDRGQAVWAAPGRERGLWAAWRERAVIDRGPEAAGLRGARAAFAGLPETAEEMLAEGTRRLGLPAAGLETRFHRLLMSVGGWAAYARHLLWKRELEGGSDAAARDLLAIRLGWEVALLEVFSRRPGFAERWDGAHRHPLESDAGLRELAIDCVLQSARDKAAQRELARAFAAARSAPAREARPAAQAVFCIDVRSEVFRRALEQAAPEVETLGFAGFFGFPIAWAPFGEGEVEARCPALLAPSHRIREGLEEDEAEALEAGRLRRRAAKAWKGFRVSAVSSFAFVETLGPAYLARLASDALGLTRPTSAPGAGFGAATRGRLAPMLEPEAGFGLSLEARADLAEGALRGMSLREGFARVVLLCGHGSRNVNNPHAGGLDCGACGGKSGEANARVAAAALNDPRVRAALRARGIAIPQDTWFVGGLHDTTSDEVTLYDAGAPRSHAADLARLREGLGLGGALCRSERAARLTLSGERADGEALGARGRDWGQVRPEWGLAGCSAFVAAPRARTAGLDLGGRAFLHSYDWRGDAGFSTLELIMTAPVIVASWINLQYYGSSVDNRVFGSGDKTLHNVVGGLGVLEGQGGDLRPGLPWQSVHDGEALAHEPLRLSVVIEAPREAMSEVIARNPGLRDLLDNGWLTLFAMDGAGRLAARYAGGGDWAELAGAELSRAA
ncbi:MAG: YbcC family protein [Pseudomonadota bacterium]